MKQAQTTLSEPGAATVSLGGWGGTEGGGGRVGGAAGESERERERESDGIIKVHGELPVAVHTGSGRVPTAEGFQQGC